MPQDEMDQQWQARSQQAHQAIARWRRAHPKATLAEIEAAIDQELAQVRARLIEDVAQQEEGEPAKESGWTCPQCGAQMHCRGQRKRSLQTRGGQQVTLSRDYQSCPACGYSFFPPR